MKKVNTSAGSLETACVRSYIAPMTTYYQMRKKIHASLCAAGFTTTVLQSSQSILDAKLEVGAQRRWRYFNYKTQGYSATPKRRAGIMGRPSEKNMRFYLYATILRAWVAEFGVVPKVYRHNFAGHPFANLITTLLYPRGNTKLRHHLEEFFAYRNRIMKNY